MSNEGERCTCWDEDSDDSDDSRDLHDEFGCLFVDKEWEEVMENQITGTPKEIFESYFGTLSGAEGDVDDDDSEKSHWRSRFGIWNLAWRHAIELANSNENGRK